MQVYGHRGAGGEAPENTLGGFRHAWSRGTRRFELDVRLAADGKLVVIHDARVDRTTADRGTVVSFSSAALGRLDARRGAPPWPRREGVPTLEAVLKALPRAESWQIEIKADGGAATEPALQALRALIARLRRKHKVIVTSSSRDALSCARELMPDIARGLICAEYDPIPLAEKLQCSYIVANYLTCTPALRFKAWRRKILLSAWTVNDPAAMRNLRRMQLHSIITDYPSMAVPLLGQLNASGTAIARLRK